MMALGLGCSTPPVSSRTPSLQTTPAPVADFPARDRKLYESVGEKFMVVSQGEATTRAAREIFLQGGNTVDAAAAASFTIAVERPQSTGLAGGGFMVLHLPKKQVKDIAVDFRERAPLKAKEKMYQDAKGELVPGLSTDGALAVGVPGMVAGIIETHRRYGKLSLKQVLKPAIELAEKGYPVYAHLAAAIKDKQAILLKSKEARAIYFTPEGLPLAEGQKVTQPGLAKVLRAIAEKGRDGFYKGWVAEAILKEQKALGGMISQRDLDTYSVAFRKPVSGKYGEYEVVSMPPSSSGGVHVIEILKTVSGFPLAEQGAYDSASVHETASAMQLAFYDRSKYLGDSDFVKVPLKGLTSDAYTAALRKSIVLDKAKRFTEVKNPDPNTYESKETTHFTIADAQGNVVVSTQTINGWFGSGVVVENTGLVLNNEMDDFSSKPGAPNKFGVIGGTSNAIAPQKRPLSSMSPTIVKKAGKPVLALGSPSGSQILTCVALTALNYLTYKMPLYESVTALRYHHQWTPDKLTVEAPGFSPELTAKLKSIGYDVETGGIGCKVQAVSFEKSGLRGVSDPRGEGMASGERGPDEVINVPTKSNLPVTKD